MNHTELDQYLGIIKSCLIESGAKINKWREKFMLEVLLLYLIIPGRINFLQLGRYGKYSEQRYRQQFEVGFDWLSFNSSLVKSHLGSRLAIAFDPSYISKSGKCTPYLGRFWSGCAGKAKRGLEISGIGVIDLNLHTCLHLEAVQTPDCSTLETVNWTLVDWYLHVLRVRKEALLKITCHVVADAYFSKATFVNDTLEMGFHVISRLRDDASMRYLTTQLPGSGRGRPKQYDGKIDIENPDESRFEIINLDNGQGRILSAVVNAVSLKRNIRLCIWQSADRKIHKLYFSTDTRMDAKELIDYYRTRFQIEFCFRDAKQFTGLTDCQSRDLNKLHFHFNASLTSVNLAKVKALEKGTVLSMASVKVLCNNIFLMQRFISVLGTKPNEEINRRLWEEGIKFAAIAA
jgi:transposase DDE domain